MNESERLSESLCRMDAITLHQRTELLKAASELRRLSGELEASRAEQLEQARIIGMSAERELALRAELEALKRAISEAEPVAWDVYVAEVDHGYVVDSQEDPQLIDDCTNHNAVVTPLYTLKGIK